VSVWGNEGPLVELVVVLAVACAALVALRRASPVLMLSAS